MKFPLKKEMTLIHKKWLLLVLFAIVVMTIGGLLQTARGAKATKPVLLAKMLRISPRIKEMFPREQVILCAISSSPSINTSQLTWTHRVRKDSRLTVSPKAPANCRLYTAPSTIGWDRVTANFNNQHFRATALMIIPIVSAPPAP